MMLQENKAVVSKFFELLARDQSLPEDLLGPDFGYHVPGSPLLDLKATRKRMAAFSTGFSDSIHHIEDLVAEGDRVAFRSRLEMIHSGEFMGVVGDNERISIVEMGFMRISNGKIVEMWGILDTIGLMQQIGAMPSVG